MNKCNSLSKIPQNNSNLFKNEFEKSVCGFNKLPTYILVKIFTYLDDKDLEKAQLVCQRWKQSASHPNLWKKIKIQELRTSESVNVALKKIWMFHRLEKVYIKNVTDSSALLKQIYRCLPNLQHLILRYCNNLSSQTMKVVLKKCQQLKLLDLKGTSFDNNDFYEDLPKLRHLKVLNLSDTPNLTIEDLFSISLNCQNLEEFYISVINSDNREKQLTDDHCNFIVSNMAKNLKGFSIDGATLTDFCFQRILLCPKLEHFGFHRAFNLNGKTFSIIWQYLKYLKTLKLTFGNQVSNRDVQNLFRDGRNEMKNLETIDFTGCWKLEDDAIEVISESCLNLKKLILKCCKKLTDIECLKRCEKLEILNIAFCSKLKITTWLPVPHSIRIIFIDKGSRVYSDLIEDLKGENGNYEIHLCHSQYKKNFEKYYVPIEDKLKFK